MDPRQNPDKYLVRSLTFLIKRLNNFSIPLISDIDSKWGWTDVDGVVLNPAARMLFIDVIESWTILIFLFYRRLRSTGYGFLLYIYNLISLLQGYVST